MSSLEQEGAGRSPISQSPLEDSPDRRNGKLIVTGIIFAVTFLGVLQPPGGTNDKGQTNLKRHYFVPFIIFNTIGSTAASMYIFELIEKLGTSFLFYVAVLGIAMAYGAALVAISEDSVKKFAGVLPVITLLVLWGYRSVKARCC